MTRERYLLKHLEAHDGPKPYRCDYDGCKKGFETQELLNAHWEHVHIGEVSVYNCPKCGKGSSTLHKIGDSKLSGTFHVPQIKPTGGKERNMSMILKLIFTFHRHSYENGIFSYEPQKVKPQV